MGQTALAFTDRTDWLEKRRSGIGGSDAPVIVLGEHFGRTWTDLWMDKVGLAEPQTETPAMRRGKRLEDVAADLYTEQTGQKVRRVNRIISADDYPFMLANVDRIITGTDDILEIKVPASHVIRKYRREGVPQGYQIQGQHYLKVLGRGAVVFGLYDVEWDEVLVIRVERDEELISLMVDKEAEFWGYVQAGEAPPEPEAPAVDLPAVGGEVITMDSPDWARAIARLRESRTILEDAKAYEAGAQQEIKGLMDQAGADVAEGAGARIYWRPQAGRRSLDKKALKKAHPDLNLDDFMKQGKPSRPFRPYLEIGRAA